MTINLTVPQNMQELRPRITVVGVGGAGCNAVNNMINADLEGVDFLVANTDGQALAHSKATRKIQLGSAITQGLGAGSKPEIGRAAAEESLQEVMAELADCNMVFITAGMGGGTGTGAAPVIARAARERGILTVGVITKPFEFEGQRRMLQAEDGIEELQAYVDTLIIIPNQNLFRLANERTTFADAFHMADAVLHQGVCGVTDLMIKPGLINLDFADIRAVMGEMGKAMMGTGEASGESRATQAAEAAINNPLLDEVTMKGANAVLINITGGMDMTLFEVDEAANRIRKEVDTDATIIFGSAFDDKLEGIMRVSVVATGINSSAQSNDKSFTNLHDSIESNLQSSSIATDTLNGLLPDHPSMSDQNHSDERPEKLNLTDASPNLGIVDRDSDIFTDDNKVKTEQKIGIAKTADTKIGILDEGEQLDIGIKIMQGDKKPSSPLVSELQNNGVDEGTINSADNITSEKLVADELSHSEISVKPRKGFIPAQATSQPDSDNVPVSVETPVKRPSSLINRISGLWSAKPDAPSTVTRTEPEISEKKSSVSVLDLSNSPIVNDGNSNREKNGLEVSDDELDIPAFLRRQAN